MSFSVYNDYIIAGEEISTSPIITSNLTAGTSITTRRIISSDSGGQVSIGYGASTIGTSSVAIGLNTGGGTNSVSIGAEANINNANFTVAIGYQAGKSNNLGSNVCIGHQAGADGTGLKSQTVTIGNLAGYYGVETKSVAIGHGSGYSGLGSYSVAVGYYAGASGSKNQNVAIGYQAGYTGQGINSIAIGYQAGNTNQHDNSIILNATGTPFTTTTSSAFFVKPIRVSTATSGDKILRWSQSTGEIYQDVSKTFVINHPVDKEKYLVHGCLEGPEAGVYYRGQSEIVNSKSVEVILPEYTKSFSQFTVQVTGIYNNNKIINYNTGQVEDGKFMVYGQNGRFFWLVHALRLPINVEPLKSETVVKGDGPYKYIV
jgi:hypothetical protein